MRIQSPRLLGKEIFHHHFVNGILILNIGFHLVNLAHGVSFSQNFRNLQHYQAMYSHPQESSNDNELYLDS